MTSPQENSCSLEAIARPPPVFTATPADVGSHGVTIAVTPQGSPGVISTTLEPSDSTASLTRTFQNTSPPGNGAAANGEDGADAVEEEERICKIHGKKRRISFLTENEDGTFSCSGVNTCKLPRSTPTPTRQNTQTQDATSGSASGSPDITVVCSLHGKGRSIRNMVKIAEGDYRCQPNFQCRLERGPGRSSPLGLPAPGLMRNTSSNMSIGSDMSFTSAGTPAGGFPMGTPPLNNLTQPQPLYVMQGSPQIGLSTPPGVTLQPQPVMMSSPQPGQFVVVSPVQGSGQQQMQSVMMQGQPPATMVSPPAAPSPLLQQTPPQNVLLPQPGSGMQTQMVPIPAGQAPPPPLVQQQQFIQVVPMVPQGQPYNNSPQPQ